MTATATTRRRPRGFTLPEVLATMVLIGIVLPAAMKALSLAMAASDDARKKVEATALAENLLAELSADAMSGLQGTSNSGESGPARPGYRWESSSVVVESGLTELTVRVAWTSRGRERSVVLSTMVYGAATTGTGGTTGTGTGTAGGGT